MSFISKLRRRSTTSFFTDAEEMRMVIEVQDRLMLFHEDNPGVFDEIDVKNIIGTKRYTRNYLQTQNGDVIKTVEMIKKSLIWRKEHNLPRLTNSNYPLELLEMGVMFVHGKDLEGNCVVYLRSKYLFFVKGLHEFIDRFVFFNYQKALEEGLVENKRFTVVVDASGLSMGNLNLSESLRLMKTYLTYVPNGMKNVLIHNLPWIAKTPLKVVLKVMPSEMANIIKVIGTDEITNYIAEENVPNFIRNPRERYAVKLPSDVKDVDGIDLEAIGVDASQRGLLVDYLKKISKIN